MADKRAYFKLDVGYLTNPKVAAVAAQRPTAILLHIGSIGYAAQHLTDGVVPVALVLRLTGATRRDADALVGAGLWADLGDGNVQIHDYLEHQRSAAQAKAAEASGKKAALARWDATRTPDRDTPGNADRMRTAEGDASEGPMRREREEREIESGPRKRGTRLPDPYPITTKMRTWATTETPTVDVNREHAKFCDYWAAVPGQKGVKLDWGGTWRNWMRRAAENATPGRRTPTPDPTTNAIWGGGDPA